MNLLPMCNIPKKCFLYKKNSNNNNKISTQKLL